jgi:uncharacterized membrane protein YgcG
MKTSRERGTDMKKIPIWLITILLLFTCSPLYAAVVPDRTSYVTDPIGLFSTSQKKQIEEGVKGRDYEVVVLTAKGLNESAGEKLANDAYTNWKLDANKLIVVVTVEPNFVHLVYENQALEGMVSQSNARNAKGIVDRSFVPLASQGKIAEGVIAISNYVNGLRAGSTTGGSAAPGQSAAAGEPISILKIVTILSIAILLLAVLIIVYKFRRMGRAKEQLSQLKSRQSAAELTISKMITADVFKELEAGYLQGKTLEQVTEIDSATMRLQQESQLLKEQLEARQVSFTSQTAIEQSIQALEKEVQNHLQQVQEVESRLKEIEQKSSGVRHLVEDEKVRIQQLSGTIEALAAETGYSLSVMRKQLVQAQNLVAEADQLDDFDYMRASGPVQAAKEQIEALTDSMAQLKPLIAAYPQYLPRTEALEQKLREQTAKEQLLLHDADPFKRLLQAKTDITRLNPLIETGNVEQAQQAAGSIEEKLQTAQVEVDTMISNRDSAASRVHEIEQLLTQLQEFDRAYDSVGTHIKESFASVHQQELTTKYSSIVHDKQALESLLVEIHSALDIRVQSYKLAYERSEHAAGMISRMKQTREQILSYPDILNERLRLATDRKAANKSRFYQAVSALEQLRIKNADLHGLMSEIEAGMDRQQQLANKERLDVNEIEEQLQQQEALIDQYSHRVQLLVQEKEDTLGQLRQFQTEYMNRQNRYGTSIGSSFSGPYTKIHSEGERLIAMGLFAEAVQQITGGRQILSQMDREYEKSQEEERRRNDRMGPGGGGRSSGSSGWGGGGRSSGSSGWGGGSSGGGRSSGSSKW